VVPLPPAGIREALSVADQRLLADANGLIGSRPELDEVVLHAQEEVSAAQEQQGVPTGARVCGPCPTDRRLATVDHEVDDADKSGEASVHDDDLRRSLLQDEYESGSVGGDAAEVGPLGP
jgi:hypothetical protein